MDFKTELTEYPSAVHKRINCYAREITPLEISTADIEDKEMKIACEDFYGFTMEMLSDMYENPKVYGFPVYELEEFLAGRKLNGVKQKYPTKTKSLISRTYNSPGRYMATLANMVYLGRLQGDVLVLDEETLAEINRRVKTSISPVSLEARLRAMSRIGLVQNENVFVSTKYPKMFKAVDAMMQKTKGKFSGFEYYLFERLDFRNATKSYKPTYIDYINPLISDRRERAFAIHELARECECKETINTFLKVDYMYKGVHVITLDTADNRIWLRVTGIVGGDNKDFVEMRLKKENPQMQKYALKHLWRCNACATTHLGAFVELLGKRGRVCGGGTITFQWENPKEEDMEKIRFFIKMRCEIIDEKKELEKKEK